MQRRNFIKTTAVAGAALALPPFVYPQSDIEYSIEELMGKADIELFGEGINLREEAYKSYQAMKKAAYSDGFNIKMISSYRDFYRQEGIWERKYLRFTEDDGMQPLDAIDKIIEYSTIPGTSRHHWGTDIDIIDGYPKVNGDVLVPEKFEAGGPFEAFKKWLDENSERFGFYLVYTDEPKRRGFKYEPWHYSYAPISIPMLTAFRKKNILKLLQNEDFIGCEHFTTGFLRSYIQDNILDINPKLL
ncbi:D-alanyl-D-alanine carboxypeptidase family protein [Flagellimonas allohymeniacidonis]|uniref:Twin-arginine translocation signal domain-containing protein n=1 Tax=Flagellimonas allohymeniacidonis TaxID=2517819 RepID=A0A4Q8QBM8_9FLAO|nr:D-alanyl-D-alanine carboxypeptidase family protein [Allomuricauda hymeniacidonis]TAI46797.1 twin-arginine translocation signal domain-containing protein [Allomuricauda hymeniacidonis]